MSTSIPLVDSLPRGDPFAEQYRRGFRTLRFVPPLETDYRQWVKEDIRETGTICAVLGLAMWLFFTILDTSQLAMMGGLAEPERDGLLIFVLRTLILLTFLTYLAAQYFRLRFVDYHVFILYTVLGVAQGQIVLLYVEAGQLRWHATQMVIVMAAFLPIGMTFAQAAVSAFIIVLATWGLAVVQLTPQALTSHDRFLLSLLAGAAVGALGGYLREYSQREQFLLRGMLTRLAAVDPLSGLANRREFEAHATAALAQGARSNEEVVLAMIDIDFFKRYNDRYGHSAGDQVIREIAGVLSAASRRPLDMAARLGGEEFCLLLYGTDEVRARALLDGLHLSIAALGITHAGSDVSDRVTISMGVATHDGSENLESLSRRADEMLYVAKAEGRGTTRFAGAQG